MGAEASVTMSAGQARAALLARREGVLAEIRAHPPAIPACDAHFNHLLQQRDALGRALGRLQDILAADLDAETRAQCLAELVRDAGLTPADPVTA